MSFDYVVRVKSGGIPKLPTSLKSGDSLVQEIIYRKPVLTFEYNSTRPATPEEELLGTLGEVPITLEFAYRIDPKLLKPAHNNRIAAIRERINAATRMIERAMSGSEAAGHKKSNKVSYDDLPDTDMVSNLYGELDEAMDERLVACVMRDDNGQTQWNWTGENGSPVVLSTKLLADNVKLAEAMHGSFNEWLNPTNRSAGATTTPSNRNESFTEETPKTPEASFIESPTDYGAAERNGTPTD
jgi:hypothetical protein